MCRKWIYLACLLILLELPQTIIVNAADTDLVGWWKFDETSGIIAHDSSGYGNDGTLYDDPQWRGGALEFDGDNGYVDCGSDESLNITGEVTVVAWIKLTGPALDRKIAGNQDNITGGYKFSVYSDMLEFEIRTADNMAVLNRSVIGGTILEQDVYYQVAGVYSSQGGYIRTYVNGLLDRELSTTALLGSSTGTFKIGREPFSDLYFWLGLMDDLRVYNGALTQDEIQLIMSSPSDELVPVEGATLDDLVLDTDLDGFFDYFELTLGTSPESPDTDNDGYSDHFEYYYFEFGFEPLVFSIDTDGDGLTDQLEEQLGTSSRDVDSDADGWSDFDEVLNVRFGFDPSISTTDEDFDGLADSFERELGTDVFSVDTDGDGATDFQEAAAGHDPLVFTERFGQEIGTTCSETMKDAIVSMRFGGEFPGELAKELPYPEVTSPLVLDFNAIPSAALMQRSIYNPSSSPPIYDNYNDIVKRLRNVAVTYGSGSGQYLARLFYWSVPTIDGSLPGRRLYALKISLNPAQNENEPEILFLGAHHGNEMISASVVMGLIERLVTQYAVDDTIQKRVNTTEGWFIPVVNPNGYERSCSNYVGWRKNTRKVSSSQYGEGVDLNRNYGFEHLSSFSQATRSSLGSDAQSTNGLNYDGSFYLDSDTYPGPQPFSEIETQAVRGLVDNRFRTGNEVDGIRCSLSWHSFGGMVIHPMGHNPLTSPGLSPSNRQCFKMLSEAFAKASGYTNMEDKFPTTYYPVYGELDDWLLKDRNIYGLTVEAYGPSDGNASPPYGSFNPGTAAMRDHVVDINIKGVMAFMDACPCKVD
jgi:hypothetical protein